MLDLKFLLKILSWVGSICFAVVISPIVGEFAVRQADRVNLFDQIPAWLITTFNTTIALGQNRWFIALTAFLMGSAFGMRANSLLLRRTNDVARNAPARNDEDAASIVPKAGVSPTSMELPLAVRDSMNRSDRDDFDLMALKLVIHSTRCDDGFDLYATLSYRNRSQNPLHIKPLRATFSVDGKEPPAGKMSNGFSTPIIAQRSDAVRFGMIRLYGERSREGYVELVMLFGQAREDLRCAITARYAFSVLTYPENKLVDTTISIETPSTVSYYVKREESAASV